MKQKDPIWNFFAVVEQDNKTSASCIDCKTVVSAKAPQLRAHREKCLANRPSKKRPLPVDDIPADLSTQTPEPAAKKLRTLQSSINSYCLSTDQSMSDQLDETGFFFSRFHLTEFNIKVNFLNQS